MPAPIHLTPSYASDRESSEKASLKSERTKTNYAVESPKRVSHI